MAKARLHTRLNSRLSAVATPVALIGKDRKVLFFNQGFERLTGWDAALVVGSLCEYTTEGDPQTVRALLGSLCPPPGVFEGKTMEAPVFLPRQSGQPIARQVRHQPLLDESGQVDCVLVLVMEMQTVPAITSTMPAQRLHAELTSLRAALRNRFGISTIIAHSEPMLRVAGQVRLAIRGRTALVLEGEPGTGKEHVARVIHHETARGLPHESELRAGTFVPLNCAKMLPIDLKRTLRRLFRSLLADEEERASTPGGYPSTVYLENVESMPRDVQEFVVTTLGETEIDPEPRLMAGTTSHLESLVQTEAIREDFFYLISPLRISLPPLRKRPRDFELLAQAFLERLNVGAETQLEGFSEEAWKELREYNWPGNLDELASVIEEARAACQGVVIGKEDLPFRFRMGRDAQSVGPRVEPQARPLEPYLEQVEREQIELALELARFNKKKAADLLGLTRAKLYRRMEALGLEDRDEDVS
jgi:transcriptional regulator with PAS, ATPase and Fis domain